MDILQRLNISADDMRPAGGGPEPGEYSGKSVWLFNKSSSADSVVAEIAGLPADCCGIRIDLHLSGKNLQSGARDVFSSRIVQGNYELVSAPVIGVHENNCDLRTLTLESCALIDPRLPLRIFITRLTEDENDDFSGKSALAAVVISALREPEPSSVVEDSPGYNSWPMCQSIGEKIVCAYSSGTAHVVHEPERAVYARVSSDGGVSWEEENTVCNTPGRGDVAIGKGVDQNGNMLLWVRHTGKDGFRHRLYRSADGKVFECISEPELPLDTIQITDVFHIPGVGMTALYFGGSYMKGSLNYWGKLTSSDNGFSWSNTIIEKNLPISEWPTEPSAVYLGDGKIFVIARIESGKYSSMQAQFQISSTDYGRTWQKAKTNITDVNISTPSLIYDPEKRTVHCYYFYRGRGILNCRTADIDRVFTSPLSWPAPETVAVGSCEVCEAGNVNATAVKDTHFLAYYSGKMPDTAVYVKKISECK